MIVSITVALTRSFDFIVVARTVQQAHLPGVALLSIWR